MLGVLTWQSFRRVIPHGLFFSGGMLLPGFSRLKAIKRCWCWAIRRTQVNCNDRQMIKAFPSSLSRAVEREYKCFFSRFQQKDLYWHLDRTLMVRMILIWRTILIIQETDGFAEVPGLVCIVGTTIEDPLGSASVITVWLSYLSSLSGSISLMWTVRDVVIIFALIIQTS